MLVVALALAPTSGAEVEQVEFTVFQQAGWVSGTYSFCPVATDAGCQVQPSEGSMEVIVGHELTMVIDEGRAFSQEAVEFEGAGVPMAGLPVEVEGAGGRVDSAPRIVAFNVDGLTFVGPYSISSPPDCSAGVYDGGFSFSGALEDLSTPVYATFSFSGSGPLQFTSASTGPCLSP